MREVYVKSQSELDEALRKYTGRELIICSGNGEFIVSGSAQVRASGSAQVRASDSAQVRAYDSAQVRAYGSAQVTASDSAQVRAYDSAQVRAYDSAQVRAYDSAQVTASRYVAVTYSQGVKVTGGIKIKLPKIQTAKQWCKFYGVEVKAGCVVLFKGVDKDFRSPHGIAYAPGTMPEAPDWDGGKAECGGGLHFSPRAYMTYSFNPDATKFVACPVLLKEIKVTKNAIYPDKIKAPRVYKPCYEVDINGKPI